MKETDGERYVRCICGEFVVEGEWDAHHCDTSVCRAYKFPLTTVIPKNLRPEPRFYYIKDEDGVPTISVCILKDDQGPGKLMYHRGLSFRSPKDQPYKVRGRTIAWNRAMKAAGEEVNGVARFKDLKFGATLLCLVKKYGLPTRLDRPAKGIEFNDEKKKLEIPVLWTYQHNAQLTEFEKTLWAEKCGKCGKWVFGPCPCLP